MFSPSYHTPTREELEKGFERLFGTLASPSKNLDQHWKEDRGSEAHKAEILRRQRGSLKHADIRKNHG